MAAVLSKSSFAKYEHGGTDRVPPRVVILATGDPLPRLKPSVANLAPSIRQPRLMPPAKPHPLGFLARMFAKRLGHGGQAPIRNKGPRIRRNAKCPCNSGKKFKHCHHPSPCR